MDVLVESAKYYRLFILIKALGIDWLGIAKYAQRKLWAIGDKAYGPLWHAHKYSLNSHIRGNALLPLLHIGISIHGSLENGPFPALLRALKDRHPAVREKAADGLADFVSNDFRTRPKKAGWLLEEELNKYIKELEVANPNLAIIARLRKLTQVSGKEENMKEADKDLLPEKDMRPYTWLIHIDCIACMDIPNRQTLLKLRAGVKNR